MRRNAWFSLYEKLSGNRLEYTADIPGVTLGLPEYSELSAGKAPAAVREQMLGKISSACDTINAAGGDVSADSFPVENVYTLPLRAVFVDFRTDAAVSMALALLTDYLSLAAAVSYVQKKSILAARNTAQAAASDEFFFEQNIAGSAPSGGVRGRKRTPGIGRKAAFRAPGGVRQQVHGGGLRGGTGVYSACAPRGRKGSRAADCVSVPVRLREAADRRGGRDAWRQC